MDKTAASAMHHSGTFVAGCIVLTFFVVGAVAQSQVFLNHDVGWVLHSAGWLLEGKVFGRDIIAANPPLIWFISLPPAFVAKTTGLSEPWALRLYVFAIDMVVLLLCWRALRHLRADGTWLEASAILVAAAFFLFPAAGRDFGQREYLALALGLPYLLLAAARMSGYEEDNRGFTILCGLLAGMGFALKPYFLLAPLAVELYRLHRTRSIAPAFRVENLALGGIVTAYLLAVATLAPDYLRDVIPLVHSVYWAFEGMATWPLLERTVPSAMLLLVSMVIFRGSKGLTPYKMTFFIAALAFLASYLVQAKGYSYHVFPLIALSGILATFTIAHVLTAQPRGSLRAHVTLAAALSVFTFSLVVKSWSVVRWYEINNMTTGQFGQFVGTLVTQVNALTAPEDHIYAFSTHPFPGFPTVNYLEGVGWGSRSNSQFVVPALVKRRQISDPIQQTRLDRAETYLRESVLADFLRDKPKVVLLQTGEWRHAIGSLPFDDLAFYGEDPRFAEVWRAYEEIASIGNIRIFVRQGGTERGGTRISRP